MQQWYEKFFENYARKYDHEVFTQGTIGECDFLENEFQFDKQLNILDIGCGTGRHSIELTKRGYRVTGVDLSHAQLKRAREKAEEAGVQVTFLQGDARSLEFKQEFDAAIMLCEGGFSLMETDEMNFRILKSAATALKPKGKLIFTSLNGLFPLYHSVAEFTNAAAQDGNTTYKSTTFDLMTFRDNHTMTYLDDDGKEYQLECNERYYVPSEITWMLKSLGFTKIDIYGAKIGAYSRQDTLTTEDFEMLVVAEM